MEPFTMSTTAVTASTPPYSLCPTLIRWAALPLVVFSWNAMAQLAPPTPGAGQLLKQVEPAVTLPTATVATPALRIEPAAPARISAETSMPIAVTTIELSGNKTFDTATLKSLVADAEGSTQTLAQLNALTQRITSFYRDQGQPLANAYLPEQMMDNGVLHIVIVEAVYGQVQVDNSSHMGTPQLESFVAAIKPGQVVEQGQLDRSLLLLRDLAGVTATANARPGSAPGTTDLVVTVKDAARVSGTVALDNQGSKASGRPRALATVDLRNWFGRGETFSGLAITSGTGMSYARAAVQAPVSGIGTQVGLGLGQLRYKLGDVFTSLNANGSATVLDGFVQQALVRTTWAAVNADLRFERKTLKDRVDSVGTRTDRSVTSVTPGLSGELRDELGGGGRTNFALGYTAGQVSYNDATAEALDQSAAGAHTRGNYGRVNVEVSRLQGLGTTPALAGTTLFGRVKAQAANSNLDSSEQISIAGPQGVRGYDANAVSGAQGYVATVEVRQMLSSTARFGTVQAQAFADTGRISVYHTPFNTLPNSASMHSAGLGLSWSSPNGWNAQVSVARPVKSSPAITADRSTRTWLSLGGTF